ncbi:MAG: NAD(+)/NADH kinase [Methanosphaera sp.]|nr:NAD(+)/NADH kinase [Methanosphaera sp.]
MKIFVNVDKYNKKAIETREKLISICQKHDIEICDNPNDARLICSIGGDGTFLKSSKLSPGKAMIGINCGTLGYLTDINPEDIDKAIRDLMNRKYFIEEHMMLDACIIKEDGQKIEIEPALNEIAISKNGFGVVRFDTIVDERLINSYTADGILICTPTGSTAYNLSCGGPIVDPTAEILTLTPIAAHSLLNRSIIFSDKSIIEIKITELRNNTRAYVLSDGIPLEIKTHDTVRIRKSKDVTRIVKLNWQSFIDNIHNKIK